MAARREQRVMHGGVASEVAAFFLFLLLDEQRKKKRVEKIFIQSRVDNAAYRGIHVSTYTNLYLSSSEVSESKRLDNLI